MSRHIDPGRRDCQRDLFRGWTAEAVSVVLDRLAEHGYIRRLDIPASTEGGRPAIAYEVRAEP